MKKLSILLVIALLLCFAACGRLEESPTEAPTTVLTSTTEASTAVELSPGEITKQLRDEIFDPAIEMYSLLETGGFSSDWEDRFEVYDEENNRHIWTHVTDPRFPSIAAVEAAALEFFSEELTQSYLELTNLVEKDGKLYTADGSPANKSQVLNAKYL